LCLLQNYTKRTLYWRVNTNKRKNSRAHECNQPKSTEPFSYISTSSLRTDVPIPYVKWYKFPMMTRPRPMAQRTRLAGAFITNCNFTKRNLMVRGLVALTAGRVRSYGGCENTAREGAPRSTESKQAHLQDHKFALAFENSEVRFFFARRAAHA